MSTIKLTNSVLISQDSIEGDKGVDTSNLLLNYNSNTEGKSWTATADCFVWLKGGSYGTIVIDGFNVTGSINNGGYSADWFQPLPIKKGTVINITGTYAVFRAYGLK